ncbi:MAG: hypothetical protein RTU30_07820 [Candidatus Thorarchaeota archaeon]
MEPLTHKTDSKDSNWNESYYFIFYDKSNQIGGMSRIGFKPNQPEGMTFFFLFLPDGSVAGFHSTDECQSYPESLHVSGMTHENLGNGSWRYSFNGSMIVVANPRDLPRVREQPDLISDLIEVDMSLLFHPINDTYEYSEFMTEEALEIGKKTGDMHWEQIAQVSGMIKLEDRELVIEKAMAQRDHTHGIRNWTGVDNWFYFVIWFNENLAINPAAVLVDDGRISPGGFMFKDGKNIPIMEISVKKHEFDDDGIFPVGTELELVDAEGVRHLLIAKPGPIVPVPFVDAQGRKSILIQSFGEFELDGIKGGYGSYETLSRIDK